jgi:pimeloyl-ACP methyl ester carboxylesterase
MTSTHEALHDERQFDTREGTVHPLRGGRGDPVLYLHGIGAPPGYWTAVHAGLSEGFDVIAPDHPGFGFSDVMDDLDRIDDLVYHYLDLLDPLHIERGLHLVGVSFGGWLAAELAVHSPDRFASLVLAAPLGLRIPGHLPTDFFLMTDKQRARALFHDPAKIPPADAADAAAAFQTYKDLTGLARFGWVPFLSDPKLERRLYRITARTLVLAAEHDQVVHELYHRYLDQLEWAEELGFDGIAVNEHHQTSYGIMPSPNIMAATLARRTSRAQIMVLGNAIPIRDNPIRGAEEIAMLDHLTSRRLACGFVRGIGWEYFAQSINPTRSAERFFEAHDLIIRSWTETEPFEWVTRNYEYRYIEAFAKEVMPKVRKELKQEQQP